MLRDIVFKRLHNPSDLINHWKPFIKATDRNPEKCGKGVNLLKSFLFRKKGLSF